MRHCNQATGISGQTAVLASVTASAAVLALLAVRCNAMTFTPSDDTEGHTRTNWDSWGFVDANGTWHLYYIVGGECPGRWVAYGVATSPDGVRWTDQGDVLYPLTETGPRQSCDNPEYALGSGWVWRSPSTGRWLVDWSQTNRDEGAGQSINFAEADGPTGPWRNVTAWQRGEQPFSRPDPRWYLVGGRWDTIRPVPKDGANGATGWWGFVTANPLADPAPPDTAPLPPSPPPKDAKALVREVPTLMAARAAAAAAAASLSSSSSPSSSSSFLPSSPASPLTSSPSCTVVHDFGCRSERNCGANVSARCVGGAMIKTGANTRQACACACAARDAKFTLAGLEEGACFCATGDTPDPAKCGAVPPSNASRACTAGTGGGYCAVSVFKFSCGAGDCPPVPPPPTPPPPTPAIRAGFALLESDDGYEWAALPAPEVVMDPPPADPRVEASGAQPLAAPDGAVRWYALVGAAAWTSVGGRMGMFVVVADNVTGPYRSQRVNSAVMAYQQGWVTPSYFATFFPTNDHGVLVNHQSVAPGGGTIGGDYVAPLKLAHVDANGTLRFALWWGNDVLKGKAMPPGAASLVGLNATQGFVLEGRVTFGGGAGGAGGGGGDGKDGKDGNENASTRSASDVNDKRRTSGTPHREGSGNNGGGTLAMCPCGTGAAGCAASGVSVTLNGTDLSMTISLLGAATEHIDRGLTRGLIAMDTVASSGQGNNNDDGTNGAKTGHSNNYDVNSRNSRGASSKTSNSSNSGSSTHDTEPGGGSATGWTLLQRHGMWEFYVGDPRRQQFLALPERLPSAWPCVEAHASEGLTVEGAWVMVGMPPRTPVKPAPTWRRRSAAP